jgi:hypothetical protein
MKKVVFGLLVVSLYACATQEAKTTSNDEAAVIAEFKENSKVALALFQAFESNDTAVFSSNIADTAKIYGAKYGDTTFTKAQNTANLASLRKLFSVSKANDIMLYPGVDSVTYKIVPSVRAYVRWTDDALNGAKIEHKYYAVMEFNKDHKVVVIDEFFDVTGMLNASTAPKK